MVVDTPVRLVAVATAVALALVVAGCGASSGGSTAEPVATTAPDRTATVRLASGQRCYYGLTTYPPDHPCTIAMRQRCSWVDVVRNYGPYTSTEKDLVCKP